MINFYYKIIGVRHELELFSIWWHRLFKVTIFFISIFVFSVTLFILSESGIEPHIKNVKIIENLDHYTRSSNLDSSMSSFLRLKGNLGCKISDDSISNSLLEESLRDDSFCSRDLIKNVKLAGDHLNNNLNANYTEGELLNFLKNEEASQEKSRICLIHPDIDCNPENIIKYEFFLREKFVKISQDIVISLGISLTFLVLISILYYRVVIYIIFGRKY